MLLRKERKAVEIMDTAYCDVQAKLLRVRVNKCTRTKICATPRRCLQRASRVEVVLNYIQIIRLAENLYGVYIHKTINDLHN